MWQRLYKRLFTDEGLELVHPSEEKIAVALKRVEGELGMRLPAGYAAFIRQFGPGDANEVFGDDVCIVRDHVMRHDLFLRDSHDLFQRVSHNHMH